MRRCVTCEATIDGAGWECRRCLFKPAIVNGVPVLAPELAHGNPIDADYDYGVLRAADEGHFWFTHRNRLIAWAIRRYFPDARSFIDVGCGTGGVLRALRSTIPSVQYAGADALLAGLALARQTVPDVPFAQVDIHHLPYDREFDLIGAFDVVEHLDDDEHALRELYRSTRPGGGLIVTVPQHPFLWSALDEFSRHRRRYSRRRLMEVVRGAGYTVERATSFMAFVLPLMIVSRLRKRDLDALDVGAEMRLPPVVNRILDAVCAVESAAIVAGMSFPAGGSLLLVARRES